MKVPTAGHPDDNLPMGPPGPEGRDHVRSAAMVAVAAFPLLGGPASDLLNWLVPTSLAHRRDAWFERLDERLRDVEAKITVPAEDGEIDEGFVSIVIEATKAALSTHSNAKLELLAQCVANSVLPEDRDDFLALRWIQLIEDLAPEHFLVMRAIELAPPPPFGAYSRGFQIWDPSAELEVGRGGTLSQGVIEAALQDLTRLGLVDVEDAPGDDPRVRSVFQEQRETRFRRVTLSVQGSALLDFVRGSSPPSTQ